MNVQLKKISFIIIVSCLLLFACKREANIEGIVTNAKGGEIVLKKFNAGEPKEVARVKLSEKGTFSIHLEKVDSTEIYTLHLLGKTDVINLILRPKEKLKIITSNAIFGKKYRVSGSVESQWIEQAQDSLFITQMKLHDVQKKYNESVASEEKLVLSNQYDSIFTRYYDFACNYVSEHANSLAAYVVLFQKINSEDYVFGTLASTRYFRLVANSLRTVSPNSPYVRLIANEIKRRTNIILQNKTFQLARKTPDSYPHFTLKNSKGEAFHLSLTKSKYVLLYFGILDYESYDELIKIYNKYNLKGLQIYFVDKNPDIDAWKKAVDYFDPPWINVYDKNDYALSLYNVKKIPSNYLIKVKGSIEGKNLFGVYLNDKLSKLIK